MAEILPLARADLPRALAVIHAGFLTVARDFGLTEQNCPTNGAFMPLSRLENDFERGDKMFGLFSEGQMIGFMQLNTLDQTRVELEKLTVLPNFRHAGGGAQLIARAAQESKAIGAKALTIGIIEENTVLKNWYMRNGFVPTGTRIFAHLPFTVGFLSRSL